MHKYTLNGSAALLPLALFLCLFIGSGVYLTYTGVEFAFYKLSPTVAILPALALALMGGRGKFTDNLGVFLQGVRDKNIITMCMIYLLAGAYAQVIKDIGGVDATVQLALQVIPQDMTLPGVFLMGALVSMAMGTSMGTIAALAPIAHGLAHSLGIHPAVMAGAVVSGAMFGDNLSMISDTTIASTQIHGASLKDKFKINAWIALLPMLVTLGIFSLFDTPQVAALPEGMPGGWASSLPYALVLALALMGVNVFIVLFVGMIAGLGLGVFLMPTYTLLSGAASIFVGYQSMNEILILSLLIGGLSELAKDQGGLRFLIHITDLFIRKWATKAQGSRVAEGAIGAIVSFCDVCTANNTVAIILSGETTQEVAKKYHIAPARTAALVNIFSCVFQGILPYSAQILLAGSMAGVSPLAIIPHVYYCYFLGLSVVMAIVFRRPTM